MCLRRPGGARTISDPYDNRRQGIVYGLAAYVFWGVAPVYFVWVRFADPFEVLAQRIVWALPLLLILVTIGRQWRTLAAFRVAEYQRLAVCSVLLTVNWLTFIYAIFDERIAETALGYFINPLVTILLGRFFLGEMMRPAQWIAVACAGIGVVIELIAAGTIPVLGLLLAFSFGFYGLLRRKVQVPSAVGLGVETALLVPVAAAFLLYFYAQAPERSPDELGLLALGGLVTVIPLVLFGAAAVRLPLSVLGFLQYLAPSISLVIAVAVYQEAVSPERWVNLGLIWIGLMIFASEGFYHQRRIAAQKTA